MHDSSANETGYNVNDGTYSSTVDCNKVAKLINSELRIDDFDLIDQTSETENYHCSAKMIVFGFTE